MAEHVVGDLYQYASDAGDDVPVEPAYWRDYDLTKLEAVELSRWMLGRGLVPASDWTAISILLGEPPQSLALTRKSFGELQSRPWVINSGGGPVQVGDGGIQVTAGGDVNLSQWNNLAAAVREDAAVLPAHDLDHDTAARVADILDGVAAGEVAVESVEAKSAISWLRERVVATIDGGASAGLWAATVAAWNTMFGG